MFATHRKKIINRAGQLVLFWHYQTMEDQVVLATPTTEAHNQASIGLDALASGDALRVMLDAQLDAAAAVRPALEAIDRAAQVASTCIRQGGRLIYAGSGSSGLMALADALELPGTFGIAKSQIAILLSEGVESIAAFSAETEDDETKGAADCRALQPNAGDCVIVLSASGTTPYAMGVAGVAQAAGAHVVAVANNKDAPLMALAQVAVFLPTPAEIISGSTRMGAACAQKIALNLMSTQTGMYLGHIHDGMMVNVQADNAKLKSRAQRMVAEIARCSDDRAAEALAATQGSPKTAILLATGAENVDAAAAMLVQSEGRLRPALDQLQSDRSVTEGRQP